MSNEFPARIDVDYTDGEGEDPEDYPSLQHKIEKAIEVTCNTRNPTVTSDCTAGVHHFETTKYCSV